MKAIAMLLGWTLFAWLAISPMLYIYWCWRGFPHRVMQSSGNTDLPTYLMATFIGTLAAFVNVIGQGLAACLVIIPKSWGAPDEYGEFVSAREAIGYTIGLVASIGLMYLLSYWGERKR